MHFKIHIFCLKPTDKMFYGAKLGVYDLNQLKFGSDLSIWRVREIYDLKGYIQNPTSRFIIWFIFILSELLFWRQSL